MHENCIEYTFTEKSSLLSDSIYYIIFQERHAALEKMGISVQTSGIKVEKSKYYLVNLNADPSLNELLVYYLKVSLRSL